MFTVYDHGVDEGVYEQIPLNFVYKKQKILEIIYEQNLTASAPRVFNASFYNFETKFFEKMKNTDPIFNE